MSNYHDSLSEYVSNLSDEDVKYLHPRLAQRLSGDLAEVLIYVGEKKEIDKVLSDAKSANQLYDAIDLLAKEVEREYRKRPHLMVEDKPDKKFKKKSVK